MSNQTTITGGPHGYPDSEYMTVRAAEDIDLGAAVVYVATGDDGISVEECDDVSDYIVGVAVEAIASGEYGRIVTKGYVKVLAAAGLNAGHYVIPTAAASQTPGVVARTTSAMGETTTHPRGMAMDATADGYNYIVLF